MALDSDFWCAYFQYGHKWTALTQLTGSQPKAGCIEVKVEMVTTQKSATYLETILILRFSLDNNYFCTPAPKLPPP